MNSMICDLRVKLPQHDCRWCIRYWKMDSDRVLLDASYCEYHIEKKQEREAE